MAKLLNPSQGQGAWALILKPHSLSTCAHNHGARIKLTFRDSKGNDIKTVEGNEGDDILSLAHEYDVDLEGACEGSVACSTCHVIVDPAHFDILPEADDEENDMLDLAFGLEDTSRLGCQVKLTRELDGMVATLPSATRNMYVDGQSLLISRSFLDASVIALMF
nr:adrenodoxin-type ferredoxin [Cryptococcus depauperatus CBS 7855]